ncbi:MAG: hypothetical protein CL666_14595 [Balneola sp.]|nr:hypothetical protein [Balneola sp.]|tara:strand:+ start:57820 stop:58002 length:183 start_codon:yes stop_codon:yes gene_type:complete
MSEGVYLQNFLIVMPGEEPFMTQWFEKENHWREGMTVFNLHSGRYSTDGEEWKEIERDHL